MTPGLTSCSFRKLTVSQVVALADRSGLRAIEWAGDAHVCPGAVADAKEARRITEEAGLVVSSYGTYYRATEEDFLPVLESGLALGAPLLRIWAGPSGSKQTSAEERVEIVKRISAACALAAENGLQIALEYHRGTLTDTLESCVKLLCEVDASNLRTYWQPFPERTHARHQDELRVLLPWLSHLHVFHWKDEAGETVRYPLAEASEPWQELLAIPSRDRYALIEFVPHDNPDLLPQEAATLLSWLEQR